jgi:hypothetical protein
VAIAGILFVVMGLLGSRGNGQGRSTVGEAGGEKSVLAVSGGTATPTQQATVTPTVEPTATSTSTLTVTPTPEPQYTINYINEEYSLISLDLLSNTKTKILDLVPSGRPNEEFIWERFSALWSEDGRYLLYSPADSSGNRYSSGLFLYDLISKQTLVISDKIDRYHIHGFSPDNKSIIYSSNAKGIPGLYIYNIHDSSSVLILLGDQLPYVSEWNHAGTELYFTSDNSVYKYNRITDQKELIVEYSLGHVSDLVLSPKGEILFIYSGEEGTQWLSAVNIQEKAIYEITKKKPHWYFNMWFFSNDDLVLTGSWMDASKTEPYHPQGIFYINLEDLHIEFLTDEIFENFYYQHFILENDRFYFFLAACCTDFNYGVIF